MMQNLYSIYDSDTCEFSAPFMAKNDKVAIKGFEYDLLTVCEQAARQHRKPDVSMFDLYWLCGYDQEAVQPIVDASPIVLYHGCNFDVSEFEKEVEAMQKEDNEVNNE